MLIKNIKPIFFTGVLALLGLRLAAQNPGFIQTDVIKVPGITSGAQVNGLTLGNIQTSRVFIDGLGRPVQSVALQASPVNNKDIVQPEVYNTLGQQTKGYLPYTDNAATHPSGSFRTTATADQASYYTNSGTTSNPNKVANETTYPYDQRLFENSPLQRVQYSGMTGTGFQPLVTSNKYKSMSYRLNNAAQDGNIMIWSASGTFASTYYADNTLYVTDGTDEDGLEARTFTDAAGRLVLKRQLNSGANVDTYYVYNVGGMIYYIIPPLALSTMTSSGNYSLGASPVSTLVFLFTYDNLGRLIEKTVPAKGKVSIVYDPLNRPVLMQDANMLANNQWNYIRYDVKGRAISQGIYVDNTYLGRGAMQAYVNTLSYSTYYETRNSTQSTGYYSASVFPATGTLTPLAYAYFDDYKLDPAGAAFSYVSQGLGTSEETATAAQVKGMPTMVRKATVGSGLSNVWLLSVTFYDKRLNPIQTRSNNQLYYQLDVLTDNKTTVPDFMGVPQIGFVKKQTGASTTVSVQTNLSYDYFYRIKTITQSYNGATAVTIASYTYNEMGQLVKKGLGLVSGTTYLQNVDMRYNIRGWLTTINNSTLTNDSGTTNTNGDTNDTFGMQILYDQVDGNLGNTAYYNGRISGVKWMSLDASGNKSYERAFRYFYDGMARDTAAIYSERSGTGAFTVTHGWDENRISYDVGGNIKTLYRNSATQGSGNHAAIDNLTYTYNTASNPNQLSSVSDASGSSSGFMGGSGTYSYDANGNLMSDPYKGLSFGNYNVLNRTDKIICTAYTGRYIDYTYDASGNLIRKRQYDNNNSLINTTDYIDGFVYLTAGAGSPVLQYFRMPEGRVVYNGSTFTPTYTISDHQGNVRVEFDNTGTGGTAKVRQENSYYAFGLVMPGSTVATPTNDNKKLYNGGAEWQKDYGNLPDYYQTFYRNYDAALGRWIGVDPVAESAESMTSYQYAGNNPVMFNDPNGDLIPYYYATAEYSPDRGASRSSGGGYDMFANADAVEDQIKGDRFASFMMDVDMGGGAIRMVDGIVINQPGSNTSGGSGTDGGSESTEWRTKDPTSTSANPTMWASNLVDDKGWLIQHVDDGSNGVYQYINGILTRIAGDPPVNGLGIPFSPVDGTGEANQGGESYLSQFWQGASRSGINPSNLDVSSASLHTTLDGLIGSGISSILKTGSKVGSWADRAAVLRNVKGVNIGGRVLGGLSIVTTFYGDANRAQGITAGTWVKGTIGAAQVAFPVFGLIWGGIDVVSALATGESVTDRIGDGVDNIKW